ncbi:MAG: M3 family oligoendopeptidase [Candidatus Pacearchaeota archaeon]
MKTEWDLSYLEEGSFEEKREKIREKTQDFIDKWRKDISYLEKESSLKEALDEYENLAANYLEGGDEYYYFYLKTQLDENNPEIRAKLNKSDSFRKEINNKLNFFEINLSKIPRDKQEEFLKSGILKDYKHLLESLFIKGKHILTEKEEKIMSLKSSSSYSFWVDMLSGFLSKEEAVLDEKTGEKRSYSEIRSLMDNSQKEIREKASKAFNSIIKRYEDVAENELNAILENKKVDDELRDYKRPDESRHIEDDIETEIVDSLIDSVSDNFRISQRFYSLKAKLMGVEKFTYSERSIDFGKISKNLDYESSVDLIREVFSRLDEKFGEVLNKFLEEGLINALPKKGKRDGACCISSLKKNPIFVLLNYTGRIRDVTTFAHEIGHAIHMSLMKEKNNALNIGTPKSTAEVASTFMEDFVLDELLKTANEEDRLIIMMQKLQEDISTIFRQIACYKFEQVLHEKFREKGYLSKNEIGELFSEKMKEYLGDSFERGDDMDRGWVYWPHIREYFYNYSYSSGLLISKSLQSLVKKDKNYVERVKEFLYAGTSDSPKNIFNKIGIDISKKDFWEKGLKEVESLIDETESLAKKLGKI